MASLALLWMLVGRGFGVSLAWGAWPAVPSCPRVLPSLAHVCQRIPRQVLEATYGIHIVRPREDEASDRQPTAEELLTAYGCE